MEVRKKQDEKWQKFIKGEIKGVHVNYIAPIRSGHSFVMEQITAWDTRVKYIHNNFEGLLPKRYYDIQNIDYRNAKHNLIITRDFLNWFASYLKFRYPEGAPIRDSKIKKGADIWLEITMEGFNVTRYVPRVGLIVYDSFRDFRWYREWICSLLELSYNEDKLRFVPGAGHGSSFDGQQYNGHGQDMRTNLRYEDIMKTYLADTYIEQLRKLPTHIKMYMDNFNLTEKQVAFLKEHRII